MSGLTITNRLEAIHDGAASPLYPMLEARARQKGLAPARISARGQVVYWDATWWGLDAWFSSRSLDAASVDAVLLELSRSVLNETYFIEKSGSAYAAKMMVLAKDTDTTQLYAHIASDEATHLAWIEPYVATDARVKPEGAFLAFLSSVIETASPQVLILLVQIMLEGWGLDHYRRYATGCLDAGLQRVFRAILKDEALHHHSGVIQFSAEALTPAERDYVSGSFRAYAAMIASGPLTAFDIVARNAGPLDGADRLALWTCLARAHDTQRRLDLLCALMRQKGLEPAVDQLAGEGVFTAAGCPEWL